MAIYDINGNDVSTGGSLSSNDIKTALISAVADGSVNLGSVVGATLAYTSPGTAWETNAATAYTNLLEAYKEIPNSGIPFFLTTDQHGMGVEANRWLNNNDANANGMGVINLNLGDTVSDYFNEGELSNIYRRSWQIKNHIMVFGNHEIKMTTEVPNLYDLNRWFISTRGRKVNVGPMGLFTVYDDAHSVKYICVSYYSEDGNGNIVKGLTTGAAKWLVEELKKNDGYDVVYLQHEPLSDSCMQRGDETETTEGLSTITGAAEREFAMWQILVDRKNKTIGTYTDINGGVHDYDFSGCKHELLLCLHGHVHAEWYSTASGLISYAAPAYCYGSYSCVFGLIDRLNGKVTFWVFDKNGCLDPLVLPI